jgi:uncharacterized membrane protein HdeD (DUF308 family)
MIMAMTLIVLTYIGGVLSITVGILLLIFGVWLFSDHLKSKDGIIMFVSFWTILIGIACIVNGVMNYYVVMG